MSFLAQLRQQQADAGQGLRLCYLLRIDSQHRAILALVLAEPRLKGRKARLETPGKPYVIQRPHLQVPPPFLDGEDVQRLQTLVETDTSWLRHSSRVLPRQESWTPLESLLGSGRCFVEQTPNQWWLLAADSKSAEPLHEISTRTGPVDGLSDSTGKSRERQPRSLPTTLIPVLRCTSVGSPHDCGVQGRLHLQFRYCYEHICLRVGAGVGVGAEAEAEAKAGAGAEAETETGAEAEAGAGAVDAELHYWDGVQLGVLIRQAEEEAIWQRQLAQHLTSFTACQEPATWQARDPEAWRHLLTEARSSLEALGFQFSVAADFPHHYVVANNWQARIDQAGNDQWRLSVHLSTNGSPVDLLALLSQLDSLYQQGDQSCLRLTDGRLLLLPADKVNGLMAELGDLLQYARPAAGGGYCLPGTQIHRLHALHQQLPDHTDWQGDVAVLEQAADLHRSPTVLDQEDCGIQAVLRPYQWQGVCWLQHLKRHRANGLLADDMGLGKTLQTLAHLCLEHQQGRLQSPALIVAPTSLLHNWAAEIARFAPHLHWRILHGPQRHQHWTQLRGVHIVITSYSLIVNDLHRWQAQRLSWVVLDEAQWIKNPRTQASQAVRQLHCTHRLCLSGTPVENHLGELWSILDFLMPQCLGSATDFKRYFQKPIEQDGNSERLQQLLKRVAPFMLRRTKDQVARDLPAKTEIHQTISLAEDQQAFYDELKTSGWDELQERLADTSHSGQQQILLLTALLKLRQACCDPQLLGETDVSSSKREHCVEMIGELVSEQRAILVFSQFTAMLDLLARDLDHKGIDYLMLTGQTRERQALVKAFQQGAAPVFLISLKAGGVGLNLTRADTVIHYDPWWNSSAEQQATDRAHRIGQDKPVFVYKLIAENTIEEKIADLQQRKALLSQHVNTQAQASGEQFALKLDELLALWKEEATDKNLTC